MLNAEYISCMPQSFRDDFFKIFFQYKSIEANDPQVEANSNHRGMMGRTYVHVEDY